MLRVRPGAGYGLRRYATGPAEADASAPGWDTICVPYSDVGWFADHVASFGADVVVAGPPDLRDAVISKLKGVLA
jgi:proteasome accessory factor B